MQVPRFSCSSPSQSNDGLLGFDGQVGSERTQFQPVALPSLTKHSFVQIACGDDHVLALATDGSVFSWGNGQQSQLGRRIIERRKINGLTPEKLNLRKMVVVGAGAFHSFAVDHKGEVWAWGLNSLHQLGLDTADDIVPVPQRVEHLSPKALGGARVVAITGGSHHSLFLLSDGRVFGTGRCDGCELGLAEDHPAKKKVEETRVLWESKRRAELEEERKDWTRRMAEKRQQHDDAGADAAALGMVVSEGDMEPTMGPPPDEFVPQPVHIPFPRAADGSETRIQSIASGARHNIAVAVDGTPYSWGFGVSSQLGQGDEEQMETPTAVRSKQILGFRTVAATAGGQHSALLAVKRPEA
jgi:regulator of chromosome condensation